MTRPSAAVTSMTPGLKQRGNNRRRMRLSLARRVCPQLSFRFFARPVYPQASRLAKAASVSTVPARDFRAASRPNKMSQSTKQSKKLGRLASQVKQVQGSRSCLTCSFGGFGGGETGRSLSIFERNVQVERVRGCIEVWVHHPGPCHG